MAFDRQLKLVELSHRDGRVRRGVDREHARPAVDADPLFASLDHQRELGTFPGSDERSDQVEERLGVPARG